MADTWFFLSYARLEREDDPYKTVEKFYEDLDREIRLRTGIREGHAGFYDGDGIEHGASWPQALEEALNKTRALICLYSKGYFNSEYCGKELAVFNSRLALMQPGPKESEHPKLVIPILLYQPEEIGAIPDVLSDIQHSDDSYPERYRKEGLRYFFRRKNSDLQDTYQDFLDVLVRKIIHVTGLHNPPSLPNVPPIKTVQSAFHAPRSVANATVVNPEQGPRYADFFYVAGNRNEVGTLAGGRLDKYGDEGELDWKPYLPDATEEVGLMAQSAATKEGFRYQRFPLNDDLLKFVKDAEDNNRIVILIVDAWTVRLPKYKNWMAAYDRQNFANSAVLVLRNDKDADETTVKSLDTALQQAFYFKARDPNTFVNNIGTSTDFASTLSVTLQKIRSLIIDLNNLRRIDSQETIAKPEIIRQEVTRT